MILNIGLPFRDTINYKFQSTGPSIAGLDVYNTWLACTFCEFSLKFEDIPLHVLRDACPLLVDLAQQPP